MWTLSHLLLSGYGNQFTGVTLMLDRCVWHKRISYWWLCNIPRFCLQLNQPFIRRGRDILKCFAPVHSRYFNSLNNFWKAATPWSQTVDKFLCNLHSAGFIHNLKDLADQIDLPPSHTPGISWLWFGSTIIHYSIKISEVSFTTLLGYVRLLRMRIMSLFHYW